MKEKVAMNLFDVILFVAFVVILIVAVFKHKFKFWKNLGVPFVEPRIPFGNIQGSFRVLVRHYSFVITLFQISLQ